MTKNKGFNQDRYFHNSRYLDIIVSSAEIKKLIKSRAAELDVSLLQVCNAADMAYSTFKAHYLQSDDPMSSPAIRQENIIKICEILGIKIRVAVVLSPLETVDTKGIKNAPFRSERKK